ncbi:MAG TPA: AAA family ATPase, partial [Burkholderiaceae bacterium]|nr:AAA family ATPase [Burkholderiaceae bacterium]
MTTSSARGAPLWQLLLAAAPAVARDGVRWPLGQRDAALLAWLAIEGPTPRARLAELLWPDKDGEAARNSLRQRLFQLRKGIGVDLVAGSATLTLADGLGHDLEDSDSVLAGSEVDIGGEFAAWLAQQRERRRARTQTALAELAQMAEEARDYADALSHARELLALEPLSEEAHRRVMRLHYLAGDRAAALLAFDRCERVLKDEVGARPSVQTLELLATVEGSGQGTELAVTGRSVPAGMLRPPRLVGRSAELRGARGAWQQGRVFCLEGEAGMGKSRLLQEIAALHAGVVDIRARPGDAVVPYATLVRLLRALQARMPQALAAGLRQRLAPLLPELGASSPAGAAAAAHERGALDAAVGELLAIAGTAGIGAVIVDDLHFADDASLDMLLSLARGGQVMNWGFARRPAEGSPALSALCDALLEEQRFEPVRLLPLTRDQLAELLGLLGLAQAQVGDLAASLHQHSGGNPLFALETLRQAWLDGGVPGGRLPRPVSVTRLIERRVMRLTPAAIRLARCAAVAGVDFSIALASVVLAVPVIDLADAWTELEQAQVFADGAFAHDLIHEAVRASLPEQIARHLHAEVASHLEQHGRAPASIATHWLAAGAPVRALPFLQAAGEAAARQRRFAEAAASFEREARLRLEHGDAPGAFDAALRMREALFELDLASRTDAALDLLELAASTPQQRARAMAERAIVCVHRGAMADAEVAVQAGLDALGDLDEPMLRALLREHLAGVRLWQQRPFEAHALLQSIESDVQASGDNARQIEFAQAYAMVLEHIERPLEAAQWNRRAADMSLAAGTLPSAAQILLNLALGWRDSGRLDRALAALEEARTLLAGLPESEIPYSSLDINFAIVLRDFGRYGEALQWFERAIERARIHTPGWVPNFLCHRIHAWIDLGQFDRALRDLDDAAGHDAPPLTQVRRDLVLARLQRMLGKDSAPAFESAAAHLSAGARALAHHRFRLARCTVLAPADALADAGDVLDAAVAAQRVGIAFAARTRLCQAALALGHGAEAARHARHLAALADRDGCDEMYRGEVWLAAHRALAPVDAAQAAAVLERALAWL